MNSSLPTHQEGVPDFVGDRRWFPLDLDRQTGAIEFVDTQCDTPTAQDFIDIFAGERTLPRKSMSASAIWKAFEKNPVRPQLRFIWHTAYCCSTAISKALDTPGANMSVCEPLILTSLALARRQCDKERRGDISWLSDVAFRLLDQPSTPGTSVTVKPSPISSYLVADAAKKTSGKMLFLYSDCRSFLLASMRYGENRRRFVREMFNAIKSDSSVATSWSPDQLATLTDLEVAALTWQLQMIHFLDQMRRHGDRAASLDCDAFLASPQEVIEKIWKFLELPGDVKESAAFRDPAFVAKHVKYPDIPFSLEARLSEEERLEPGRRDEIERIVAASNALFPDIANALPLPNPLATVDKDYRR